MNVHPGDQFRIVKTGEHGRVCSEGVATVVREIPSLFDEAPDMAVAFVKFPNGEILERVVHEANRVYAPGNLFGSLTLVDGGAA